MTVRRLREIYAGITPCRKTLANATVCKLERAGLMLKGAPPILAESADGHHEPRGYSETTAALLQIVDANDEVTVVVYPADSAPPAIQRPLYTEFDVRLDDDTLKLCSLGLFSYLRAHGIKSISKDHLAKEFSLSPQTYGRRAGLSYDFNGDGSAQGEVPTGAPDAAAKVAAS
jgi:hypothetical protein